MKTWRKQYLRLFVMDLAADRPDAWGFDAFVAGLTSDIKDAIADYAHQAFLRRNGYSDATEIPF